MMSWTSRRRNFVASTRTRPPVSAATSNPHSTDRAKGFVDGAPLVGAGAEGAEGVVRRHHQHLLADALEPDDVGVAELSAIEPDVCC